MLHQSLTELNHITLWEVNETIDVHEIGKQIMIELSKERHQVILITNEMKMFGKEVDICEEKYDFTLISDSSSQKNWFNLIKDETDSTSDIRTIIFATEESINDFPITWYKEIRKR